MHYLVHKQSPQGDELEVTAILEKGMMATINVKRLENQK